MVEQNTSCQRFRKGALSSYTFPVFYMEGDEERLKFQEIVYDPKYLLAFKGYENPFGNQASFGLNLDDGSPISDPNMSERADLPQGTILLYVDTKRFRNVIDRFADDFGDLKPDGDFMEREIGEITYTGEDYFGYQGIKIEKQNQHIKEKYRLFVKKNAHGDIVSTMDCKSASNDLVPFCRVLQNSEDFLLGMIILERDLPRLQEAQQLVVDFAKCLTVPKEYGL